MAAALDLCCERICDISPKEYEGKWECLLVNGVRGRLLVVLPRDDLVQALKPPIEQWLGFIVGVGITIMLAQAAGHVAPLASPPVGALIMAVTGSAELGRVALAERWGVRLSQPLLVPSPALGCFGAASSAISVVPSASALFDMAAAASATAFVASFVLIVLGLLAPPDGLNCGWINPGVLPYALRQVLRVQAETNWGTCLEPSPGGAYVAAPPALIAGCFGAFATALNTLPLGRLDGMSLVAAAPWARARDTVLPWAAFILLSSTMFDAEADSLFPVVLFFCITTFGLRPVIMRQPVLRDNVTQPRNFQRRAVGVLLALLACLLLMPTAVLDTLSFVSSFLDHRS